jgi:hypothetical protein
MMPFAMDFRGHEPPRMIIHSVNFRNTHTYEASAGSVVKDCLLMCNMAAPWMRKLDDAFGNASLLGLART